MVKTNLFTNIIKNKEEIVEDSVKEEQIGLPEPNEAKKRGFFFKPGDLLPKLPKQKKKKGFPLKTTIFSVIIIFLLIFCVSLMAANSNLSQMNQFNLSNTQNQLITCNNDKNALISSENRLRSQISECNNQTKECPKQRCTVSDCSMYINTYNSTDNPTYIQSLKSEINYLTNLTYECMNMNETDLNGSMKSSLNECRNELKRIKDILDD